MNEHTAPRRPAAYHDALDAEGRWLLIAALEDDEEVRPAPFGAAPFALSALGPD